MSKWKCSTCTLDQYKVDGDEVVCSVCDSRKPVDKNIEILTVSGDEIEEEDDRELVKQKSLDQKKIRLKGAALKSKLSKLGSGDPERNVKQLMSAGSSFYIENSAHRCKRTKELKEQIKSRVEELNRRCGYSALVVLTPPDQLTGKKAETVKLVLSDKNEKSPPNLCQGDCCEREDNQTVNRGTQFYFNVKNSQDPVLTPSDSRLRLARVQRGQSFSPTSQVDHGDLYADSELLDYSDVQTEDTFETPEHAVRLKPLPTVKPKTVKTCVKRTSKIISSDKPSKSSSLIPSSSLAPPTPVLTPTLPAKTMPLLGIKPPMASSVIRPQITSSVIRPQIPSSVLRPQMPSSVIRPPMPSLAVRPTITTPTMSTTSFSESTSGGRPSVPDLSAPASFFSSSSVAMSSAPVVPTFAKPTPKPKGNQNVKI